MAIRKALAYSKKQRTPYTRKSQKVKHLNYIKAVPLQKISKFNMGDVPKFQKGAFKNRMYLITEINCQIRDLALESARQYLNNQMTRKMQNDYYIACKPYPHQVLRNNKTFSGGSKGERIQSGMSHSFGTSEGRAAYIKGGEPVFIIAYPDKEITDFVREISKSASAKLPCKIRVIYEEVK
jgi:large subunit ribosomal protein L10e